MKHAPMIFSSVAVFSLSTILIAFAQTPADDDGIRFIYAQSIVRNSEDQLISYIETFRIGILEPQKLIDIANYEVNLGEKEFVVTEIDGIPHQWIKINRPATFEAKTVRAVTTLGSVENGQNIPWAVFTHDGYNIDAGDELTVRWTIAKPVQ